VSSLQRLECKNVAIKYGGVAVLNGVSLAIELGIITAIMGPNGAGKTTLLNCISGIEDGYTGSIEILGRSVDRLPPRSRTHQGLVRTFQMTKIFESLSIEENLFIAATAAEKPLLEQRANEIVNLVQLDRMRHRSASELSGGQRRLLEIGMCLAQEPRFLLMDEPFAGLNPMMVKTVCDVITGFAASGGGAVVVSHEIPIVRRNAHHVVVMAQGAILASGAADAVLSDARVIESYIGVKGARH
jgi:ABC-type branched-subunit amino acid transport system ATPase component